MWRVSGPGVGDVVLYYRYSDQYVLMKYSVEVVHDDTDYTYVYVYAVINVF